MQGNGGEAEACPSEEKPDEEEEDTGGPAEKEDGNQAEEIPSDSSDLPLSRNCRKGTGILTAVWTFSGRLRSRTAGRIPRGTVYYRGGVRATGWQEVGGETYFFDEKGLLQTGWIEQPEGWYYAGETGAQRLGWQNGWECRGTIWTRKPGGCWTAGSLKSTGKPTISTTGAGWPTAGDGDRRGLVFL